MMLKGKELLTVLCIALTMMVLLNIGVVGAIPAPEEVENTSQNGSWNWGISAHVWGYAVWRVRIQDYIFEDEYFDGHRWGEYGVWPIGYIILEYWIDNDDNDMWSNENDLGTGHLYQEASHLKCRSRSWFQNFLGQKWEEYSGWAEVWA